MKNRKNALKNPLAQIAMDSSVEDVLQSKMLSDPIRLLDASPITDGAAAVILADERGAKKAKNPARLDSGGRPLFGRLSPWGPGISPGLPP